MEVPQTERRRTRFTPALKDMKTLAEGGTPAGAGRRALKLRPS